MQSNERENTMTAEIASLVERIARLAGTGRAGFSSVALPAAAHGVGFPTAGADTGSAAGEGIVPSYEDLASALDAPILRTDSVGQMDYYEGELSRGALESIDFRANCASGLGILVLRARPGVPTVEREISFAA